MSRSNRSAPQPKMTFKVTDLVSSVSQRKQQLVRDYARDMKRYESRVERQRSAIVSELTNAARFIGEGRQFTVTTDSRYDRDTQTYIPVLEIPTKIKLPDKPELETSAYDYMLDALAKTTDETIKLTPSEAAYYLGRD